MIKIRIGLHDAVMYMNRREEQFPRITSGKLERHRMYVSRSSLQVENRESIVLILRHLLPSLIRETKATIQPSEVSQVRYKRRLKATHLMALRIDVSPTRCQQVDFYSAP